MFNFSTLIILPELSEWYYRAVLPIPQHFPEKHTKNSYKTILYWNRFFSREDMGLGLGQEIYKNCPVSNCLATSNRNMVAVEDFDAIVFHGPRYSTSKDGYPRKRSLHQKYIFFALESPYNTIFDNHINEYFYNWTMTYRRDSDIYYPYSLVQYVEKDQNYTIPSMEDVARKTNSIAWFVSNCETEGSKRRMRYAKELNKYIKVDIFGSCGNDSCPKSSKDKCLKMVEEKYKFYLSFENSLCVDYVTEKLYTVLNLSVVPVVLGMADYGSLAPPKSVVNVYDFDSPKELAQRLNEIADNYEDYISYFEWKKNYVISTLKQTIEYVNCQLCEMLNTPQKSTEYENIRDWFFGHKCFM